MTEHVQLIQMSAPVHHARIRQSAQMMPSGAIVAHACLAIKVTTAPLIQMSAPVKDCDKCVQLDPNFIKGHIRKGHVCIALKNFSKAEEAFQKALAIDSTNVEAMEGLRAASKSASADPEAVRQRAMQDPEVVGILQDPAMQMILDQLQREPESAREHLMNPAVAGKLRKLMESGILSMR